jgi:transcriptional regulator with XRE-family HTH domain
MNNDIKMIAGRIKELREISGISQESLAKDCGIDLDLYKKYESGESDIPLGFLYRISGRYHVEMTALITGSEPKLHLFSVVRKDQGLSVDRRKEYKYHDLAFNFKNKKAETFLVTVDPRGNDKDMKSYSHAGQEFNYVLEGSLGVNIQGHDVVLNEGDSLYFDSGNPHHMKALNNKPAKFLAVIL